VTKIIKHFKSWQRRGQDKLNFLEGTLVKWLSKILKRAKYHGKRKGRFKDINKIDWTSKDPTFFENLPPGSNGRLLEFVIRLANSNFGQYFGFNKYTVNQTYIELIRCSIISEKATYYPGYFLKIIRPYNHPLIWNFKSLEYIKFTMLLPKLKQTDSQVQIKKLLFSQKWTKIVNFNRLRSQTTLKPIKPEKLHLWTLRLKSSGKFQKWTKS